MWLPKLKRIWLSLHFRYAISGQWSKFPIGSLRPRCHRNRLKLHSEIETFQITGHIGSDFAEKTLIGEISSVKELIGNKIDEWYQCIIVNDILCKKLCWRLKILIVKNIERIKNFIQLIMKYSTGCCSPAVQG